jgi:hypothetical protein
MELQIKISPSVRLLTLTNVETKCPSGDMDVYENLGFLIFFYFCHSLHFLDMEAIPLNGFSCTEV